MKPSEVYADFWLALTHAYEVEPGHETHIFSSGEDSLTPWATSDGTLLMVYASNHVVESWNGRPSTKACVILEWGMVRSDF